MDEREQKTEETRRLPQLRTLEHRYADICWTHKVHEKQADICFQWHSLLSTLDCFFSVATTVGIFVFVKDCLPQWRCWIEIISMITSCIAVIIAILLKQLDFEGRAYQHKNAAVHFLCIRNRLQQMIADFESNLRPVENIRATFLEAEKQIQILYETVPQTTEKALAAAEKALKEDYEASYSPEEIDRLLRIK